MYIKLMKLSSYRNLIFANIINRIGDTIDILSFSWIVYQVTEKSSIAAITFAINNLPTAFILPFAGAFVEKKNKRQIMVICDFIRGSLVCITLALFYLNYLSIAAIFLLTFSISLTEAFRIPASTSFILQVLPQEEREEGITFNIMISTMVQIAGAAVGGSLINKCGIEITLIVDMILFLLSGMGIFYIHHEEKMNIGLMKESSIIIFQDGLYYIKEKKILVSIILLGILANMSMCPLDSLQTVIVVELLKKQADFLSYLNIALTMGMIVGGIGYTKIKKSIRAWTLFQLSFLYIGVLYIIVSFLGKITTIHVIGYYFLILLYLIYGIFASFLINGLGLILLDYTDFEYVARINSLFSSITTMSLPFTSFITGIILRYIEIREFFLGIGVIILILSIVGRKIVLKGEYL